MHAWDPAEVCQERVWILRVGHADANEILASAVAEILGVDHDNPVTGEMKPMGAGGVLG